MRRVLVSLIVATAVSAGELLGGLGADSARLGAAGTPGQFHDVTLVAEPVRWEIQPGLVVDGWGYNGSTPGPTIRVTEGERVRISLVNRLPVDTTIHWHGIDVPLDQDGVPGLSQHPVEPGETFVYDFIATNPGTRWYHSHVDSNMQIQLGLYGAFIVDPREPEPVRYDREFTYLLTEKALDVTPAVAMGDADIRNREGGNGRGGAFIPDLFLMNGKSGMAIDIATIAPGERVRIRLINAGNLVHAMHLHGHSFTIIATDGNPVPPAARLLKDTVLIGPSERYDLDVAGTNPGVWMFHCHINNHAANGMVTELRYDGAQPLAGGDHGPSHSPTAPLPASPRASPAPAPPASHAGHTPGASAPPVSATPARSTAQATPAAVAATTTEVRIVDDRFRDSRVTVKAGTIVTWVHAGNNQHSTSSLGEIWDSGLLERGQTFSVTFDTPGTYPYLCRQHLSQGMRGAVVVESPK